jgi:hyperosmotically inducible protein
MIMGKVTRNLSLILCLVFTIVFVDPAGIRAQENAGEHMDDTVITAKVNAKLLADPGLNGLPIRVETSKGIVQLSGFVDTGEQAQRAVEIAKSVESVRKVKNSLIAKKIY